MIKINVRCKTDDLKKIDAVGTGEDFSIREMYRGKEGVILPYSEWVWNGS